MNHLAYLDGAEFARARKRLREDNKAFPAHMIELPREQWAAAYARAEHPPERLFRSRFFLASVYPGDPIRVTINRCDVNSMRSYVDGITWDEIQQIKREIGFGDQCAIEIYPPDEHIVNVANMRHIWIVPAPSFMWK